MKIAYLVFAYKNPEVLGRVIKKLSVEDSGFFIHIDKKYPIEQFSSLAGPNVFFAEKRLPVYWAEYSGIKAILNLIHQALRAPNRYDYFVLLSGSEYPLRSGEYIHKFLEDNTGLEFINLVKMPNESAGKPISRINTWRVQSGKPLRRLVLRAVSKLGLYTRDYRKYLQGMDPYAGNTWWALSRNACEYLVSFIERNPNVEEFFQGVFAPEETFFQTILGNSLFRSRARRNLVYEDWSAQGAHPAVITESHIDLFEARDKIEVHDIYGSGELLFARKFSDQSKNLLNRIDKMIERKECQIPQQHRISL